MRKGLFFIMGILLLLLASCIYFPGHYRLARTNKRVDFHNYYNSPLMPDTNAAYLYKTTHGLFYFERFFGNGRNYISDKYTEIPTLEDYNNLKNGQKLYYDFTKDGYLRTESYLDGFNGYYFYYAKVYPDSIVTFKFRPRGLFTAVTNANIVGIRTEVKLTNFNVDW